MTRPLHKLALQQLLLPEDNAAPLQPFGDTAYTSLQQALGNKAQLQPARRLKTDWVKLLLHLTRLGSTLFVSHQGDTSHEKLLQMYKLALSGGIASIEDQHGSLELDLRYWHCGFVTYTGHSLPSACVSLHFFDINGCLLHSIYPTLSLSELGSDFLHNLYDDQPYQDEFLLPPQKPRRRNLRYVDTASLSGHWRHLKSCSAIPVILQKHGVSRLEAIRLLAPEFSTRLKNRSLRHLLKQISKQQLDIKLSLHNNGVRQSHLGRIQQEADLSINCRSGDAYFRLELDDKAVYSTWLVHKPVEDHTVSSLEVYNAQGELMLMLSAHLTENTQHTSPWDALLEQTKQRLAYQNSTLSHQN